MIRKLLALLVLIPSLAFAGTVTGVIATPSGGVQKNLTISFTLNAPNTLAGSFAVSTSPALCYTDGSGNVVGLPTPLTAPVLSQNISSGTLAANTYFVKYTWSNASGESAPSPESTFTLTSTGTLIVSVPANPPPGATSWKIYISATTGTETLQSSVASPFAAYSQASSLSAGTALPSTNTSQCQLTFNDSYLSQPNYYTVSITTSTGQTINGISRTGKVYFSGGTNGTVNIANGLPDYNGQGVYPSPIMANPPANSQQTINGALNVAGQVSASSVSVSGAGSFGSENGVQVVGNGTNTNIAAAVTAASTTGAVMIPPGYVGTDVASTTTAPMEDKRQNSQGQAGDWHGRRSLFPVTNFPGGNDYSINVFAPADIHLSNNQVDCTSSTSIVGAGTNTITVGTCSAPNGGPSGTTAILSHAPNVTVVLEPGTANEETVTLANWSILSGTTLSVTTTLNHTQPYPVRQQGGLFFDGRAAYFSAPSGTLLWHFGTASGNINLIDFPVSTGASFPNSAINFIGKITGGNGATKQLLLQNNNSSSAMKMLTSTGVPVIDVEDAALNLINPGATIIYGNNGGTGTSGSIHFRNNQTDQTEKVTLSLANGNITSVGQFISSVATGTAPLSVASTTNTPNLNASILTGSGTAATLTGTGACATITTQTGGAIAGRATCTGTTGASTLTITTGLTAPNGWVCQVYDQTTRANLFQQTATVAASCTLTATSVTQNDVFVFSAIAF